MAKIKMPKGTPSLDMTPMVDLAFLLVTFFMLTATSRVSEPVIVDTPSSISDKLLPENVMLITIDDRGRAFYNVSNAEVRIGTLNRMAAQYKVGFTDKEKKEFSGLTSFGVPIAQLKEYINANDVERKKMDAATKGIPHDSLNNQLKDWIMFGRIESATQAQAEKAKAEELGREFEYEPMRFAIKADGKAKYISVKDIITIFTDMDVYRFNLITSLEDAPVED
jgi:biopolymer transport protein ExbD